MDPRHPELVPARIAELIKQYDRTLNDIRCATTSAQIAQLERESGLVVQEICLVAPRLHEHLMQVARDRRYALSHPALEEPKQAPTVIVEPKPRKKKTTKKKTTKKDKK